MSVALVTVTVVAAAMTAFSAASVFARAAWVVKPIADYGVPAHWLPFLGAAKAAGAVGLLVGLAVPPIGIAAAIGLLLYFTGAVVTVVRARWFGHVPFPLLYAAPVVAALVLAS
ncbi:DoxX family protein [Streptomyces sp. VRA16 Mangrove soil]|uniref:DoxX family protein n=1 Tax=Streptomyces sp. VRA16 Mangrove soil TaxID=2817434 RepID=UPI001A9D181C|nr:DoxX family protein [Streptomyces sp. VRA16 Mangrove soil]MBO1337151.1 DoxX family protein [Streptomyces sp. VRA16 Mangrove soil]